MDPQIEGLRREIRMLRRFLILCAVAIVGLAATMVLLTRTPSSLTIGAVTIHERGIEILDAERQTKVNLRADVMIVGSADKGGILLSPGEFTMNDAGGDEVIRMRTWNDHGNGAATLTIDSGMHGVGPVGTSSGINVTSLHGPGTGGHALVKVYAPLAQEAELSSMTPADATK